MSIASWLLTAAVVSTQHLVVSIDPEAHRLRAEAGLVLVGPGDVELRVPSDARVLPALPEAGIDIAHLERDGDPAVRVSVPAGAHGLRVAYTVTLEQDVARGEVRGQIHNFEVDAHIGPDGVFLGENGRWQPQWIGPDGHPQLVPMSIEIDPIPGWVFVASGDPTGPAPGRAVEARPDGAVPGAAWSWRTPRPVSALALVGNRHVVRLRRHETPAGTVEIAVHVSPEREPKAELFLEAVARYLELYTPLLGPFPFRRFSVVENFFSSGFAFPGFTLLGAEVIGMAPRSLAPGYLDHEMLHSYWGNGVYLAYESGNWAEPLAAYCANYYRRVAEDGDDAGRDYRRGILMGLASDRALDAAPLDTFGRAGGASRFVGYDKGAFVFAMLSDLAVRNGGDDARFWAALRRLVATHLGRRATWDDIEAAFDAEYAVPVDAFFDAWVHDDFVPQSPRRADEAAIERFRAALPPPQTVELTSGRDADGPWVELDPDFRIYRALPPEQLIPSISGTRGPGGYVLAADLDRSEVAEYAARLGPEDDGENLLVIGRASLAEWADLVARTADPIDVSAGGGFTVGGETFDAPGHAVLHTMPHPDRPGRFITVFLANGDAGWQRLPLIGFYGRDTTVVWRDGAVEKRRLIEPDRRLR